MFLVIFCIPIYILSSIILWPFLNIQSLLFGVDTMGHNCFCWDWLPTSLPYFDFDFFICRWCPLKYVTPCMKLVNTLFMFKSYFLLSPCPAHGLTCEMELSMLIDIFCSSFLCVYHVFIHDSMFPFLYDVRVLVYLGTLWEDDRGVWYER